MVLWLSFVKSFNAFYKEREMCMGLYETVAVDIGYGFVKAVSSNGNRILFPSVVGSGRERNLGNFMRANNQDLSELHIKVDGNHYFIGEMAEKNSSDSSRIFDRERYKHNYTKILLNTAIHLVTSTDTERVTLFTGLPFTDFQTQSNAFRKKLNDEDTPKIEWISGSTQGIRKVDIDYANVFPQAMSSILAAVINHEGKLMKSDIITSGNQVAVIDIGYRTTDVCVVEMRGNGAFTPLMKYSDTIDKGVVNLYEHIKKQYQDKTGGSDLSESKIGRILQQKFIRYKGREIDLSNEVEEAHRIVAHSINDKINSLWKDESDTFDYIFVVGGGGTVFRKYLQENYEHPLQSIVDTQFANAIGYYRFGKLMSGGIKQEKISN
jgi:plasmid segregation protein ParM